MNYLQNIPDNWGCTRFGDVIESVSNGIGGNQNKDGIGIPVSRIETIADQTINFDRVGFIAEYEKEKIDRYLLNKGDILFSHINSPVHLGKTAIFNSDQKLYHGINLLRIVVSKNIMLPIIFNYFCKYTRAQGEFAIKAQHAVNQSSLNQKKLADFSIPLPPLAEQHQIAAKLDELLAQVDSIKTRLDAIPNILKRFRQSVLAAAVSGKLTEEWRKKNQINTLPRRVELTAVCNIFSGFAFKKSQYSNTGSKLLQIANVGYGRTIWEEKNYIPIDLSDQQFSQFKLFDGDIVIALNRPITNETLKVAKLINSDLPATLYQRVACLRSIESYNSQYVFLCLQSPDFLKQVKTNLQGSDQPYLNSSSLPALKINSFHLDEQTVIVRRVEQLFAYADQIEQRVKDAQSRVNHLTQSVLAKAFRGELTADWRAQNPDLISGENSAEVLLARIQAERVVEKPKRKRKLKA